jgi:hypothetical protein
MNPETILWTRVLLQAIWDLAGIRLNAPPRDIPRLQASARAWICSDADSLGSFRWTCYSLSLDPATVRRRLFSKTKAELGALSEAELQDKLRATRREVSDQPQVEETISLTTQQEFAQDGLAI